LKIYSLLRKVEMSEITRLGLPTRLIETYEKFLTASLIRRAGVEPEVALNPIEEDYATVYKGNIAEVSPEVLASVLVSRSLMPIIVFVILIFAVQIAATSMALEKEQ
jgi:ABC-type Na+ efflux pump permease subunit